MPFNFELKESTLCRRYNFKLYFQLRSYFKLIRLSFVKIIAAYDWFSSTRAASKSGVARAFCVLPK